MKIKLAFLIAFLVMLCFLSFLNINITSASPDDRIFVDNPINYALQDTEFTVNVRVTSETAVYGWQVNMSFNPDVLQYVNVTIGDFLADQPEGTLDQFRVDKATKGWILAGSNTFGQYPGVSGNGTLAIVRFHVKTNGESVLNITKPLTYLLQSWGVPAPPGHKPIEEFPSIKENGFFTNIVSPPVADFTYSPSVPLMNQPVTFDASASQAVAPNQIIGYNWTFGDGTGATGVTVEHAFTAGGNYRVTLTVVDDAVASDLVEEVFGTTSMPPVWYALYSSKAVTLSLGFGVDIAVTHIEVSSDEVTAGETISIEVTVVNRGTETESFNVIVYRDITEIEPKKPVSNLAPTANSTVPFSWDTSDVLEGVYSISAEAVDVQGEQNPGNNRLIYGSVTINAPTSTGIPLTTIAAIVGVIVVVVVVIFLLMRRRRSKATSPT
jgi:PKD repeat protein